MFIEREAWDFGNMMRNIDKKRSLRRKKNTGFPGRKEQSLIPQHKL